jgi:hypothetical protein
LILGVLKNFHFLAEIWQQQNFILSYIKWPQLSLPPIHAALSMCAIIRMNDFTFSDEFCGMSISGQFEATL